MRKDEVAKDTEMINGFKKNGGIKNLLQFLTAFPFYPILMGIYPVIYLWMVNFNRVNAFVVPRSLLTSLMIASIAFILALIILRRLQKAGLISGIFLLLFYSYGHVFRLVDNASIDGILIGRHRYMLILWFILFAVGAFFVLRSKSKLFRLTRILNVILVILLAVPLLQIGLRSLQSLKHTPKIASAAPPPSNETISLPGPDVYYIVLDSYSRDDVLKEKYNLDNGDFIAQLESLGFTVPKCTHSNYDNTIMSISSALNMNYIDQLGFSYDQFISQNTNEALLAPQVRNSAVQEKFTSAGYKIITFSSLYAFISIPDSDLIYNFEETTLPSERLETLNFQNLFLETTLARVLVEWADTHPEQIMKISPVLLQILAPKDSLFTTRNYKQYQQNIFDFETLEKIPELPGKKFVYAHLFTTHQPFTFNRDGSFRTTFLDSKEAYIDQIVATNRYMLKVVKTILEKSSTPPVIILQSDHNYTVFVEPEDKFKILNVYYLPDNGNVKINADITPVNTFRLVFNQLFGDAYPLLNDSSFLVDKVYPNGVMPVEVSCDR